MAEVVEFFMQSAFTQFTQGPFIGNVMVEDSNPSSQPFIYIKDFTDSIIDCSGAGGTLHNNSHIDTPAASLHKRPRKSFVPEVISHPQDFTARRYGMDTLFKKVA